MRPSRQRHPPRPRAPLRQLVCQWVLVREVGEATRGVGGEGERDGAPSRAERMGGRVRYLHAARASGARAQTTAGHSLAVPRCWHSPRPQPVGIRSRSAHSKFSCRGTVWEEGFRRLAHPHSSWKLNSNSTVARCGSAAFRMPFPTGRASKAGRRVRGVALAPFVKALPAPVSKTRLLIMVPSSEGTSQHLLVLDHAIISAAGALRQPAREEASGARAHCRG